MSYSARMQTDLPLPLHTSPHEFENPFRFHPVYVHRERKLFTTRTERPKNQGEKFRCQVPLLSWPSVGGA